MRSAETQRTTYYQSRSKALATADTFETAEIVRLQCEAVSLATGWSEFQALADQAMQERQSLPHGEGNALAGDVAQADIGDINHQ